jgi:hypothetical protein
MSQLNERPPDDEREGWDDPDEEEEEREEQGEDPTSPLRGFHNLDELEEHDAEADKR